MAKGLSTLDIDARERLIVALGFETIDEARGLVEQLGDAAYFYKVGWELLLATGIHGGYVELIRDLGEVYRKKVMADLKLLEIPETVRRTIRQLRAYRPEFVTFHAQEYAAIEAAVEEKNGTKVLAVTVLTSMAERDLQLQGIDNKTIEEVVRWRAKEAFTLGCDGVISSGQEAQMLRREFGYENFLVATPGIRDDHSPKDDQKRRVTVEEAFENGADYIVVGRPITREPDPRAAALAVQARIAALFP